MKNLLRKAQGFTLIELLIVIALIGILAVALLSAINPLEQLRKGRDSTRKADASELLNAIERFNASYQCYPWNYNAATTACNTTFAPLTTGDPPSFAVGGNVLPLLTPSGEVKTEFSTRITSGGGPSVNKLFMAEVGGTSTVEGAVRICYEPESNTGRTGGFGIVVTAIDTDPPVAGTCPAGGYNGSTIYTATNCHVCVPQL